MAGCALGESGLCWGGSAELGALTNALPGCSLQGKTSPAEP